MMALLGLFVFKANKKELTGIDTSTTYNYARVEKLAAPTEFHAVGTQDQSVTLQGRVNTLQGGKNPLDLLDVMAGFKIAYPLFIGDGDYRGDFIVEGISVGESKLLDDGVTLEIEFTVDLTRVYNDWSILAWLI